MTNDKPSSRMRECMRNMYIRSQQAAPLPPIRHLRHLFLAPAAFFFFFVVAVLAFFFFFFSALVRSSDA